MPNRTLRRLLGPAVAAGLMLLLSVVGWPHAPGPVTRTIAWLLLAAVLVWGQWAWRGERRAHEAELARAAARTAVAEERLAIARDLHDLVSGGLGAITVRAAVAQRLEGDAAGLRAALADIESASRQSTDALRRMLAVLRGEAIGAGDAGAAAASGTPIRPAAVAAAGAGPSFSAALQAELTCLETAGLKVDCTVQGSVPSPLEPLVLAVVREGLSNVARHAGPTRAEVNVRQEGEILQISIVDEGPSPTWVDQPGAGLGLRGLAERVEALGGQLEYGPAGSGFALLARWRLAKEAA
ncbi:sensory histidine kinase UhpB [Actinomyces bovis]|uniref:histidine kinase n=1 Tax=Actinomyces bovis TaxID=1658 RepID=A0ABY1VPR4_9ACTO|nr:histidine kinase [Actinomyces bovis]SPT53672.1 sensory histidine kinase UhpB [Actinomyces bovis]VEG55774.1 sensory histidine kinase UhpB [Actinomyces israelii]